MVIAAIKESLLKEKKNYGLMLLFMIYAFMIGGNIPLSCISDMGLGEYILLSITDHYYIVFAYFMYAIFWIMRDIKEDRNIELVRYGSYKKYYAIRKLCVFIKIIIVVIMHVIIAMIIGLTSTQPTYEICGKRVEGLYVGRLEIIKEFSNYFDTTPLAILCAAGYMIIGTFFLYEILFYIFRLKGNTVTIAFIGIMIVMMVAGMKLPLDDYVFTQILFINNYIIFHHNFFPHGNIGIGLNIILMIVIPIIMEKKVLEIKTGFSKTTFCKNNFKIKKTKYISNMISSYKMIIVYVVILIGLKLFQSLGTSLDGDGILLSSLMGFSYTKFNLMYGLYYLAYFIFPVYIICCFLENEKQDRNILAMFRYGSKKLWKKNIFIVCLRYLIIYAMSYITVLLVITRIINLFNGGKESQDWILYMQVYGLNNSMMIKHVILSMVMKVIELILLFEIVYLAHTLIRRTIVSFMLPIVGYVVSIVIGKVSEYNPFGASAILNSIEIGYEKVLTTVIISILIIIVLEVARRMYDEYSNKIRKCK